MPASKALTDHPRSRGEYIVACGLGVFVRGSSPLSRGIQPGYRVARSGVGIIPALAGNTGSHMMEVCGQMDHPRSRGEYRIRYLPTAGRLGSSPLSRGIRSSPPPAHRLSRIIPALAGNTNVFGVRDVLDPDHPRSRGEYASRCVVSRYHDGSSPLSRGILHS